MQVLTSARTLTGEAFSTIRREQVHEGIVHGKRPMGDGARGDSHKGDGDGPKGIGRGSAVEAARWMASCAMTRRTGGQSGETDVGAPARAAHAKACGRFGIRASSTRDLTARQSLTESLKPMLGAGVASFVRARFSDFRQRVGVNRRAGGVWAGRRMFGRGLRQCRGNRQRIDATCGEAQVSSAVCAAAAQFFRPCGRQLASIGAFG